MTDVPQHYFIIYYLKIDYGGKMNYKSSFFNFLIPVGEKKETLLYNSLTGGLAVLYESEGNFLSKLFKNRKFKRSQIDQPFKELFDNLLDSNYIMDCSKNERDILLTSHKNYKKQRLESGALILTIAPTLSCNLACRYCFQNPSDGRVMEETTFKEVVRFIEEEFDNKRIFPDYKLLSVSWYGGEPLLEIKRIKEFSLKLIEVTAERGISYKSFIPTNGTRLSEEVFRDLKDCHISEMMVTLDGPQRIHDTRRPAKAGNFSPYKKIMESLKTVPHDMRLIIRINCDKEVWRNIEKLYDDFEKYGLWPQRGPQTDIDLAHISVYDNARYNDQELYYSWREFTDIQRKFTEFKFVRYNDWAKKNKGKPVKLDFKMPTRLFHRCGCANSPAGFAIDPEGHLYKCWEDVDKPELRIQHVSEPINLESPKMKRWLSVDTVYPVEMCKECKVLPVCNANCAKTILDDRRNFRCSPWKFNLEETIKKQYVMNLDEPEKINPLTFDTK